MTENREGTASDLDQLASSTLPAKPVVWDQEAKPLREATRRLIAGGLLLGYLLLVFGVLCYISHNPSESGSKELLTLLITSYTTLLGSALGYYFGRQED